jgi:pimeloyl-ACP methyl ester carboxylesterase
MEVQFELELQGEHIVGVLHDVSATTRKCIISCHGLLASKDSNKYITLGRTLSSQGIPVARFDFRGCGESTGQLSESHVTNRLKDLDLVIEYLKKEHNYSNFGLFGSSMGGFISFLKASSYPQIKVMVSLSSPYSMNELFETHKIDESHFEIDSIIFGEKFVNDMLKNGSLNTEILTNIRCPVHIFQGDSDGLVPVEHAKKIYNGLSSVKEIKIIPGGDHVFSQQSHLNEIITISSEWFRKYITGNLGDQSG